MPPMRARTCIKTRVRRIRASLEHAREQDGERIVFLSALRTRQNRKPLPEGVVTPRNIGAEIWFLRTFDETRPSALENQRKPAGTTE